MQLTRLQCRLELLNGVSDALVQLLVIPFADFDEIGCNTPEARGCETYFERINGVLRLKRFRTFEPS
jgi:hypothetical protein